MCTWMKLVLWAWAQSSHCIKLVNWRGQNGDLYHAHTTLSPATLSNKTCLRTALSHTTLSRAALSQTQIFRTQPCQQASFTPNSFTQNIVAHKFVTAHLSYPTLAHRTLSHTTCSHVALSHATDKSFTESESFIHHEVYLSCLSFGSYWKLECVQCLLLLLTLMPNAAVFFALHLSRPIFTLWTAQRYGCFCFSLSSVTQQAANPFNILNKPILQILPAPNLTHILRYYIVFCCIYLS